MQRSIATLFLTLTLAPAAALADPALVLWQGARLGMTPAETQAAFPAARPTPGRGADGVTEMSMPVEAARLPARARFLFRNDRLYAVSLVFEPPAGATINQARDLTGELRARYGEPYDCGPRRSSLSVQYFCNWRRDGLEIRLSYVAYDPARATLGISYQADGSASGNL